MTELPKDLTTNRVIRMIDNIQLLSPECTFKVPSDMFCHSTKLVSAEEAKHEIKDLHDLWSLRPDAGETTWSVWYRKYNVNTGFIEHVSFTAHNSFINSFNPGNVGLLD